MRSKLRGLQPIEPEAAVVYGFPEPVRVVRILSDPSDPGDSLRAVRGKGREAAVASLERRDGGELHPAWRLHLAAAQQALPGAVQRPQQQQQTATSPQET